MNVNAKEFCEKCNTIIKEEYGEEIHTYILHNGEGYLDLYLAEDQDEISEKLYEDTECSAEFLDNMVEKIYGKGYSAVYQNDVKNMGYEVDEIIICKQ